MIARLYGKLLQKTPPLVLIDCQGVGYECEVPMSTFYQLPAIGETITLMTHFVVREDAQLLYGFATERERTAFRQLLKVNGIGAKSALSILSGLSVEDLSNAIALQEVGLLTRIPGIGKKTAERLLLELKDKFLPEAITLASGAKAIGNDVLNALLALGYSEKESLLAVKQLGDDLDVSEGIRQALKMLAKS
ncbi:MAG: Holliday junction branch migration protein RuvA [Candidatus Methylopumilus sp.]|jgi:Holliday junction DNA helicase RuvA|nr:Holliday junction branch migration protein RuvA [Candidatus Methylopumilus sp.]NBW60618.1 Holliday junction branch migration protein RuvA [Methylophilaceae bacterium]